MQRKAPQAAAGDFQAVIDMRWYYFQAVIDMHASGGESGGWTITREMPSRHEFPQFTTYGPDIFLDRGKVK